MEESNLIEFGGGRTRTHSIYVSFYNTMAYKVSVLAHPSHPIHRKNDADTATCSFHKEARAMNDLTKHVCLGSVTLVLNTLW